MARLLAPLELSELRDSSAFTHRLFRFPGRFHPPLVTYLIGLHPDSKIVGDPMAGCGTAAVEARAMGKSGLFSDVDPLACLLTRAKSNPVDPKWLTRTVENIVREWRPTAEPGVLRSQSQREIKALEDSTVFRAPPEVFHWFSPYVAANLCRLLRGIDQSREGQPKRDALLAYLLQSSDESRVQILTRLADLK